MPESLPAHDEFMRFAEQMAEVTGPILMAASAERPDVEFKPDASFVTSVDRAIETKLREMIETEYPDHGIYGEEFPAKNLDAEFVWVLDPIDGTAPFIAGIPVYGTLIALAWQGAPFVGLIDHPATVDRWTGVVGRFAKRNGHEVRTRRDQSPASSFVTCSNPDFMSPQELERFSRLRAKAPYVQYGGSCYAYGLLASGRTDIAIDSGLEPFDFFACSAVVNGAGGVMTDWEGASLTIESSGCILASGSPSLHRQVVDLIRSEAP